ncbi:NAD(P)-binding protein [Comamonadaceae bacterium G21597-S1]|nr:NAD(P)-binding protein [Comamonadaceae bacterium G21597-S1]
MTDQTIETDYLIIGAGASGLCVADVLVAESNASMLIVDRHDQPGGHWNHAYPFVRLHQPSATYGVNSLPLGQDRIDPDGLNRGLYELATGPEVLAYFDRVMRTQLLPGGRVDYRPMSEYLGSEASGGRTVHRFRSSVTGLVQTVVVRKKLVDTRLGNVMVPATHPVEFSVAPDLSCVPLNALPQLTRPYPRYVVVGAGKTGVDACLWLLTHGIDPDAIRWIVPRDAWLQDRANVQPGDEFLARTFGSFVTQMETVLQADSASDLLLRLEAAGQLLRLDPDVLPTMYRCATVSREELAQLRRIRDVVRLGRVTAIEAERIVLEHGTVPAEADWLYVHCSAVPFQSQGPEPIFQHGRIAPQLVRNCQPMFSAALIAFVETLGDKEGLDDAAMNRLCQVVPLPEQPHDWIRMQAVVMLNQYQWSQHAGIRQWMERARLDGFAGRLHRLGKTDPVIQSLAQRFKAAAVPATMRLQQWSREAG